MIHTKMSSPVSEKDMTVPKGGKEMEGAYSLGSECVL